MRAKAVNYPASSRWVTGVGGTNIMLDAPTRSSAGGLERRRRTTRLGRRRRTQRVVPRPAYQKGFVAHNRRVVPDVSMLADVLPGYDIYCSAQATASTAERRSRGSPVGGTSAAAPLLAGGLALVDQVLRSSGRQQLGLANPLLYKIGHVDRRRQRVLRRDQRGNDLGPVIGGNHQPLGCCTAGPGFDYASGLGQRQPGQLAVWPRRCSRGSPWSGSRCRASARWRRRALTGKAVSCSRACLVGAYAEIAIGRARAFKVSSTPRAQAQGPQDGQAESLARPRAADPRRPARPQAGLRRTFRGVIVDSGGNVESAPSQTAHSRHAGSDRLNALAAAAAIWCDNLSRYRLRFHSEPESPMQPDRFTIKSQEALAGRAAAGRRAPQPADHARAPARRPARAGGRRGRARAAQARRRARPPCARRWVRRSRRCPS